MNPAILTAINVVTDRSRFYYQTGILPYKPWVAMISDGRPSDENVDAGKMIRDREGDGKVKFFTSGSEDYNSPVLHQLAGEKCCC
jgi:uncharacterized protein YegL